MEPGFLERFHQRAQESPERVFAVFSQTDRKVTVGELFERASRFASLIGESGAGEGSLVFVILHPDFDAYAAFLGAMLIGAIPSFLPYPNPRQDENLYWAQHEVLFQRTTPTVIVCHDDLVDGLARIAPNATVVPRSAADERGPAILPRHCPGGRKTALLQHSSGTTGLKKGVALSYGAIEQQIDAYARSLSATDDMIVATWLPLYHDMGLVAGFLMPFHLGRPIIAMDPFEWVNRPAMLLEAIERHRATHVWMPNFAFIHLARAVPRSASFDLSSLKTLISCSEPCKGAAFDAFLARFERCGISAQTLQTCYAMAETVFAVSQSPSPPRRLKVHREALQAGRVVEADVTEDADVLLSNGRSIDGCDVTIVRDDKVADEGLTGEICVRSDFMFSGYHRNDEATADASWKGWFRTGDIGFVHDGEIYVSGRRKEVIIVSGKNIFAHDVEAALDGVSGIKPGRAVAMGVYDDRIGSEALLVIAEESDPTVSHTEVKGEINRAVLSQIGIPCSRIEIVRQGWLVKTTSGKISRSENLKKLIAGV